MPKLKKDARLAGANRTCAIAEHQTDNQQAVIRPPNQPPRTGIFDWLTGSLAVRRTTTGGNQLPLGGLWRRTLV
jgi:hypothetical protein